MSTATRIFGPYSWPGKSEETVTTSERVMRILRGIELFTLVYPLDSRCNWCDRALPQIHRRSMVASRLVDGKQRVRFQGV